MTVCHPKVNDSHAGFAMMPDNYAATLHFEVLGEMYALYYDYDDPKRKAIPKTVANWLDENIGKRDPENARKPAARRKPRERWTLTLCPETSLR
jgi:hypothetical protein